MNELLMDGIELMFVGMGIVFLFLAMLVVAVNVMSSLITRFIPEPISPSIASGNVSRQDKIEPNVVAAISAAIHNYKSHKKS